MTADLIRVGRASAVEQHIWRHMIIPENQICVCLGLDLQKNQFSETFWPASVI